MLNAKQEKFIQNIVKGMSQREAYKDAYNAKYKDEAIDTKASLLFKMEKVQNRYNELINELEDKTIMNAKERMKWLTSVINNELWEDVISGGEVTTCRTPSIADKLKAIDTLNKMSGEYITKVEADVNTDVNIKIDLTDDE